MTNVITAGESGSITEIIEIGPTSLVRRRSWANFQPLADACKTAGLTDRCPMAWLPVDPTAGADDTEVPNRIRLLPLASVLAGQAPFFRYNRLRLAPGPGSWPRSRTASQRSSYPRRHRIAPWLRVRSPAPLGTDACAVGKIPVTTRSVVRPSPTSGVGD